MEKVALLIMSVAAMIAAMSGGVLVCMMAAHMYVNVFYGR